MLLLGIRTSADKGNVSQLHVLMLVPCNMQGSVTHVLPDLCSGTAAQALRQRGSLVVPVLPLRGVGSLTALCLTLAIQQCQTQTESVPGTALGKALSLDGGQPPTALAVALTPTPWGVGLTPAALKVGLTPTALGVGLTQSVVSLAGFCRWNHCQDHVSYPTACCLELKRTWSTKPHNTVHQRGYNNSTELDHFSHSQ